MLETKKKVTLTGSSVIDGTRVSDFRAIIDSENPENMSLTNLQINRALYKANHATCIADQIAFEEYAFALQDEMIANKQAETTEG